MAVNPSNQKPSLSNPNLRQNEVNDADFQNQHGYYPYDLTHQEFLSTRFGEVTPSMHLHTIPGDRIVVKDNTKTILSQINGNLLSTVNQYVDSYYVPMRSLYPINYEKFRTNPTKGSDLPNSALPRIPFGALIAEWLMAETEYVYVPYSQSLGGSFSHTLYQWSDIRAIYDGLETGDTTIAEFSFAVGRMLLLSTILSRGQLLDYLGLAFDNTLLPNYSDTGDVRQLLQLRIDNFQSAVYRFCSENGEVAIPFLNENVARGSLIQRTMSLKSPSDYRSFIADAFEKGYIPILDFVPDFDSEGKFYNEFISAADSLRSTLIDIFGRYLIDDDDKDSNLETVDTEVNYFDENLCINISSALAYQQVIAQYYTNDSVDNIFNSDLFMQNLRSVMFPSTNGYSIEPTFDYNGVATEYDLISYAAVFKSLISDTFEGKHSRQIIYLTLMFLMRRSLRYGDYFTGARPRMLAVSDQLSIDVSGSSVSPIDVTKSLLMQRYLNAANYQGSGFLQQFAGQFGVVPSDTGTFPRFIGHRKIELQNKLTNNTAEDQGKQTTNLVGYSDDIGFDVFIDDFGIIITLVSYDVLPVYTSGIDNTLRFTDRFDYFNAMLQNIGDQVIHQSDLFGNPELMVSQFGYTMRNAEYKYKVSKAHGAFVNSLRGFLLPFPLDAFLENGGARISPDFIRDKPKYLDRVVPKMTGISPGEYFHFLVACTNQVNAARKMQDTPPILF